MIASFCKWLRESCSEWKIREGEVIDGNATGKRVWITYHCKISIPMWMWIDVNLE